MEQEEVWYSLSWFSREQLLGYDWKDPTWLYLLWVLPMLFVLLEWIERRRVLYVAMPASVWRSTRDRLAWIRYIPRLLALTSIGLFCMALARPQRVDQLVEKWSEGIDIVLAVDVSPSMEIEDFRPNRLTAAKAVAREFIEGRTNDRIGLVVFAGEAYSKTPLTKDYELLLQDVSDIAFGSISKPGTAIGSAIATSTNRMRDSEVKSKIIILLSDGENTSGVIDPVTAARLANAFKIKIYTIAVGREGQVPWGRDFLGRRRYVESHIDISSLKRIAEISSGKFYRAENKQALATIFSEIDELERSEIKEERHTEHIDYYTIYVRWGLVFLLSFLFTRYVLIGNRILD